ncbi:hypothetical protein HZC32_02175 [Candidatus Woesearchaeota archaeon]|nr:hypothetical protein [Candidatus Woesearchaeota archaeon]
MDVKELLDEVKEKVADFFTFVASKLSDFKNLSLGEQIAYPCVGLGFFMIVISLILFIV